MNKRKAKARAKKGKSLRQVGAVPYRVTGKGEIEVMVITSRGKRRFLFPKGWKMKGKSAPEAAAREALEEAGVVGTPAGSAIGRYEYCKRLGSVVAPIRVTMFPMRVRRELSDWSEKRQRKRAWVKPSVAEKLIEHPGLGSLARDLP
ncbi:NUDIX hydrolase [Kumtagia ephedrae]|jgi:8-oxo-dGTP pyrophosphatase MutT (NUDIX family)|uniref:NUDIX hydrolase n=1 Tax=Kumtagia ephedrae TaxID=2116701 RepID=A0A2P7S2K9_9HYPH|nr:NUDIX hydrolase [Mesorhizobium ephedrae]PSJ56699.1 NUDIX hydrolase [Mesorhizobium ephedrae]